MFIQIHIFTSFTKEVELSQRSVSHFKNHYMYFTSNILHIFVQCVHSVCCYILKFPIST